MKVKKISIQELKELFAECYYNPDIEKITHRHSNGWVIRPFDDEEIEDLVNLSIQRVLSEPEGMIEFAEFLHTTNIVGDDGGCVKFWWKGEKGWLTFPQVSDEPVDADQYESYYEIEDVKAEEFLLPKEEFGIEIEKVRRRCRDALNKTSSAYLILSVAEVLNVKN